LKYLFEEILDEILKKFCEEILKYLFDEIVEGVSEEMFRHF